MVGGAGIDLRPPPCQGVCPKSPIKSVFFRGDFHHLSTFVHGFHGHFMGARVGRTPRRAAQVILGMVAVGASDNILGRAKHAWDVVDRYAELQKHRGTRMPQHVRRHIDAQPRKLTRSAPGSTFLRENGAPGIFDHVAGR